MNCCSIRMVDWRVVRSQRSLWDWRRSHRLWLANFFGWPRRDPFQALLTLSDKRPYFQGYINLLTPSIPSPSDRSIQCFFLTHSRTNWYIDRQQINFLQFPSQFLQPWLFCITYQRIRWILGQWRCNHWWRVAWLFLILRRGVVKCLELSPFQIWCFIFIWNCL